MLSAGLGPDHYIVAAPCAQAEVGGDSGGFRHGAGADLPWNYSRFYVRSPCKWNLDRNAVAIDPGAPLPIGLSSMRTTGTTTWLAEVRNASRAPYASSAVNGRSSNSNPSAAMTSSSTPRVIPRKMPLSAGRVITLPSLLTI